MLALIALLNLFLTAPLQAARPRTPLAPTDLVATAASSGQINLTWQDKSSNESGFIIQRSTNSTSWNQIATAAKDATSYSNTALNAATRYYYRVCAYNSRGSSAYSAVASATTLSGACAYTLSASSIPVVAGASSGSVNVTAGTGCSWTATTASSWIHTTSAGNGSGTAYYTVDANPSTSPRSGTISVQGQILTINQVGAACTYALSASSAAVVAPGGSGSVNVTAGSGCAWTAATGYGWIHTTSAGNGSGTVYYTVDANTSTSPRSGTISVQGQIFTINQAAAACTYALSASSASVVAGSSSSSVNVTAGSGCGWTATTGYSWIHTTSAGNGNGAVYYTVDANTSTSPRSGTISVQGQIHTVNQAAAACTYTLSASSASVAAGASSGSVNVTAGGTCVWTAVVESSGAGWISITSGNAGTGNGAVYYAVTGNTSTSARTGTMTIAGRAFTISQAAGTDNPPTASLVSPASGATLSGTTTFTGTATDDNAVARVEFWCDGSLLLGTDTSAPYSIGYNTANIPNGTRSFTCKAYDTAGNSRTSAAVSATVNNTGGGAGQFDWSSAFGGTSQDYGHAVAVDRSTGDIVLAASFGGEADFGGGLLRNYTASNLLLAKYNEAGTHLWSKGFGGPGSGRPLAVAVDSSGNVFVTGWFSSTLDFGGGSLRSTGPADPDIFLAKYSSAGVHLWSKRFGSAATIVTLDPVESGRALAVDPNGDVVVGGSFLGTVDFGGGLMTSVGDLGFQDAFLAKFSGATGAHLWSKHFGEAGQNDAVTGVVVEPNGNIVATGGFEGTVNFGGGSLTAQAQDVFVAKYASSGGHIWSKRFGGLLVDTANSVAVDPSGNVAIIGNFGGTVDFGGGLLTSYGAQDVFVAKLSASGAHAWSKRFGGSLGMDSGTGVAMDTSGNVFVTGFFLGTVDFGGGARSSAGGWDLFVAKFSPTGAHAWSRQVGGSNIDEGHSIAVDAAGSSVLTGRFFETVDFGGGTQTSAGVGDIFLVRYAP